MLFGDGAFGCTGFDYDTLVRFNLPVVGVVGNNAAWNQIRFGQIEKYGSDRGNVANLLAPTRYDRVVEALGGYGEHVTEPGQIRPALDKAPGVGQAGAGQRDDRSRRLQQRHEEPDDVQMTSPADHPAASISSPREISDRSPKQATSPGSTFQRIGAECRAHAVGQWFENEQGQERRDPI